MAFPEAPFRMVAATSLLTVIPTSVLSIVPAWPCRIAFALFLVFVVSRLVVDRGASAAGKAQGEGLPNLAAVAARLHALPGDALCQIHRLAAVSIARLPTS